MSCEIGSFTKHKPSLWRWLSVALYALAGALLAIPGALLINAGLDTALESTEDQIPALGQIIRYVTVFVSLILMVRQSRFSWRHFKNLWSWPPVTVSVPLGFWMLSLGISILDTPYWVGLGGWHIQNPSLIISFSTSSFVVALWLISKWMTRSKTTAGKTPQSRVSSFEDLEELPMEKLLSWLDNEAPITHEDADLFGSQLRAHRIFEALKQKRPNPDGKELYKTAVIQGPFGSGKSTIVAFIKEAAQASGRSQYIFAHVNCWGFSSTAAQEHILDQAISQLSEHVDCLSLHHLPAAYADAISDSSSWLAALTSVMGTPSSPVEVLRLLTPILRAIGAHLIIVIEDTDRNSSDFDQKQIEAMLHSFRQVECVSFVLTAGSRSQIDFPKIAEHIQFVPRLPTKIAMTLMDRVRQHCMNHWKFVDPTSGQNRPERLVNDDREDVYRNPFARTPSWIGVSATLLDNPRSLKKTLSSIVESWCRLHGEVDIDELIMLSVLRHTAPSVFDFFGLHRAEFEDFAPKNTSESSNKQKEERLAYLKHHWLEAASKSGHDAHMLGKLLGELVYATVHITGCEVRGAAQRCQSIKGDRGDVYWERITSEAVLASDIRDQEVLKVITTAKETRVVSHMAEKMATSSDFSELLLGFQKYSRPLDAKLILEAASLALPQMRPLNRGLWNRVTRRFELIEELIKNVRPDAEMLSNWLLNELIACLPNYLRDADTLYFNLGRGLLDTEQLGRIRSVFVAEVKKSLLSLSVEQFAQCFPPNFPWVLSYLVILDRKQYPESFLTQWSQWKWLAPYLLEGMSNHSEIITPQVICALGESGPGGVVPTWFRFDERALRSLFGKRVNEALRLLSQPLSNSHEVDGWFPVFGPLAAKEAKRLLDEGWTTEASPVESES